MTTKRIVYAPSGSTVYAVITDLASIERWNNAAEEFQVHAAGPWADYAVPLFELTGSGDYVFTMPSLPAGVYDIQLRQQEGEDPALTDDVIDVGVAEWNGEAFIANQVTKGAYPVSIAVQDVDSSDPIEGALVRLSRTSGSVSYALYTDADGVALFGVNDGDWVITITKPFYTFEPIAVSISENYTDTLAMSSVNIPAPTSPALCVVAIQCLDMAGSPEVGAAVTMKFQKRPDGSEGFAYSTADQEGVSDVSGMVYLTAVRGASYAIQRGSQVNRQWQVVSIPVDSEVVEVTSFSGP